MGELDKRIAARQTNQQELIKHYEQLAQRSRKHVQEFVDRMTRLSVVKTALYSFEDTYIPPKKRWYAPTRPGYKERTYEYMGQGWAFYESDPDRSDWIGHIILDNLSGYTCQQPDPEDLARPVLSIRPFVLTEEGSRPISQYAFAHDTGVDRLAAIAEQLESGKLPWE